ncbi:MAG: AAA family ATPase [Bdellovibrionota bacterium]
MTFETKSLVHIVVWGPLTTPIKTSLSPKSQLFTLSSERHILLYGAHQRQENDAEEALSMALKLRSSNLKIFVTTENVLIESNQPQVSWNDKWNETFETLSTNEIAVSLDLVRIYQRIFEINAKRIKNESVFLLKEKKSKPDRIRGIQKKYTPLVGRKKELNTLLEVVEQSFEDQGQIASIIGDAGLGKTRLTAEFKSELVKRNIRCLEGLFSLNSDMNFRGFHQIVAQLLENNTETFSRWNLNPTESAFLRFFLHPEEKFDELKDLNETELTQGIFHSIQKLLSIVGQQPLVLILDDFHWAGERSVELMDVLSTMIEKTRIAFILIHRPSFTPSFQKKLNYHQIKLNPLQHEETKELVKNALHLDYITDGAIETLNNLSLGNPLFVEEVLRELINRKELEIQKDEDLVRLIQIKFPQGVIPTNIQSLITARLDLLTKEAKEILQWVCAFGFRENHDDFELFLQTMHLSLDEFHSLLSKPISKKPACFRNTNTNSRMICSMKL